MWDVVWDDAVLEPKLWWQSDRKITGTANGENAEKRPNNRSNPLILYWSEKYHSFLCWKHFPAVSENKTDDTSKCEPKQ